MDPARWFGARARSYAIGALAVLLIAALKLSFDAYIGTAVLFLLFSAAVLASAWIGGSMPGVATTLLSGAVSGSFLVHSRFLFGSQPGDTILIILFLIEGTLISLAAGQVRSARGQRVPGTARALETFPAARKAESAASDLRIEIETLDELRLALGGELNIARLVEGVTEAGVAITGAAFGAFLYADVSGGWTHFVTGAPPDLFVDFPISQDTDAFGSPVRGGVWRSDDLTEDPRYGENLPFKRMTGGQAPARSYVAAPVRSRSGQLLGGLFFGHPDPGVFRARDERLVAGLAAHAAIALDNAHLYREAQEARRTAEAASQIKDEFLATLSHELRTPLNAIVGWAHLLKRGRLSPDEVRDAIDTILRNATAQSQIVEELLDVSRIATGKMQLDLQPVEVGAVVKASVGTVTPAANAKDIRLQFIEDPAGSHVIGDPERLQQVFWNLLSNAIKFTEKHGRVRVSVQSVDSSVEIAVADNGIGIDPEFLPIMFNRFTQMDSSSTRAARGLGVGLAITRQLVELHGGSVEAESPGTGQGSTFTVSLPRSPVTAASAGERIYSRADVAVGLEETPDLAGVEVLIVDDDGDARMLVAKVLEGQGAFVTAVSTARKALEILGRKRIDVLLSDIEMPGTNGYQLVQELRLRSSQEGGAVPAVALTAYARTEDRLRALRAGFQLHLSKPVQPSELVAVVASLVTARRSG